MVRIGPALEDPVLDQPVEAVGQHRLRDVEVSLEVAEAPNAVERVADDEQRPPFADTSSARAIPQSWPTYSLPSMVILAHMGSIIELVC